MISIDHGYLFLEGLDFVICIYTDMNILSGRSKVQILLRFTVKAYTSDCITFSYYKNRKNTLYDYQNFEPF
jgi:hypothetical protein